MTLVTTAVYDTKPQVIWPQVGLGILGGRWALECRSRFGEVEQVPGWALDPRPQMNATVYSLCLLDSDELFFGPGGMPCVVL